MNNNAENLIQHPARLKWACRRGMLELDVLLGNFLERAYPQLSTTKKESFHQLLECSDPDLFAWLIKAEVPEETKFLPIIEAIKTHARDQFSV